MLHIIYIESCEKKGVPRPAPSTAVLSGSTLLAGGHRMKINSTIQPKTQHVHIQTK
jgi:hypothetical protein